MRGWGRWAVVAVDGLARLGVAGVLAVVMWLIVDSRGSDAGVPVGAVVPVASDPWWTGWPMSVLVVLTVVTVVQVLWALGPGRVRLAEG